MGGDPDFKALRQKALRLKGGFLILSGPSGVGKSMLIEKALSRFSRLRKPITYTTRSPRGPERSGAAYHFVRRARFQELQKKDAFLEWAEVYGELYATAFAELVQAWEQGKAVIKDVDTQGGRSIKAVFPHAARVFIYPPSLYELKKRLIKRDGEDAKQLSLRLQAAEREIAQGAGYEHKIINKDFQKTWRELKKIIETCGIFSCTDPI